MYIHIDMDLKDWSRTIYIYLLVTSLLARGGLWRLPWLQAYQFAMELLDEKRNMGSADPGIGVPRP